MTNRNIIRDNEKKNDQNIFAICLNILIFYIFIGNAIQYS